MTCSSTAGAPCRARSAAATCSACQTASLLPRVPSRRGPAMLLGKLKQRAQRGRVAATVVIAGALLELYGRLVEQLVHNRAGQRLQRLAVSLRERPQPRQPLRQLGFADALGLCAQRGDRRDDLARVPPVEEPRSLL